MSTIQNADKIIVLQEGKLLEEGTHEELVNIEGHYKMLWKQQNGNIVALNHY